MCSRWIHWHVEHVGLGPGAAAGQLARLDQPDLEAAGFEQLEQRDPVDAGRFHGHGGDAALASASRRWRAGRRSWPRTGGRWRASRRRRRRGGTRVGRDADHVHVGVDVDAGRVGVEDGQGRRLLAWRPRRSARAWALAGTENACVGSWCRLPCGSGAKTAGVGQEGNRRDAVSPTGSTQRRAPLRVTNDRVAASRARLHDGHEAPVPCRPRTHAGRSRIVPEPGRRSLPLRSSSQGVGGRARHGGFMASPT